MSEDMTPSEALQLPFLKQQLERLRAREREGRPREHHSLASALVNLALLLDADGAHEEARGYAEELVALRREMLVRYPAEGTRALAESLLSLAGVYRNLERMDDAIAALRESAELHRERIRVDGSSATVALADVELRLADTLGDAGRHEEAVAVIDACIDRWTALREEDDDFRQRFDSLRAARLAEAHYIKSYYLDELERYEEAAAAARREIELRGELSLPEGALAYDLAAAYNNLSNALKGLGRDAEELAARREAIALRRRCAEQDFAGHGDTLAEELERLAERARAWGDRGVALTTQREAVALWRKLGEEREPELASAIDDLAGDLLARGELDEALSAAREAVELYDRLEEEGVESDLSFELVARGRLAKILLAAERYEAALAAAEDALARAQQLASAAPAEFSKNVAFEACRVFEALYFLDREPEVITRADEVESALQRVAASSPEELRVPLAVALEYLSEGLRACDLHERALVSADAGVRLLRSISEPDDEARARLSRLQRERGISLTELGRDEDSLAASVEAVELLRSLSSPEPLVFAETLRDLRHDLAALGRHEEALAAVNESIEVLQALPEDDEVLTDLAESLLGARFSLRALERHEDAAAATEGAAAAYRRVSVVDDELLVPTLLKLRSDLNALGRGEEAMAAVSEALQRGRQLGDPLLLVKVGDAVAEELSERDMVEEAATARREGLAMLRQLESAGDEEDEDDDELLELRINHLHELSYDLVQLGHHDEALPLARELAELYRDARYARIEPDPTQRRADLAAALENACDALRGLERFDEALPLAERLIEHRRALVNSLEDERGNLIDDLERLAVILMALGRKGETEGLLAEASALRERLVGASEPE